MEDGGKRRKTWSEKIAEMKHGDLFGMSIADKEHGITMGGVDDTIVEEKPISEPLENVEARYIDEMPEQDLSLLEAEIESKKGELSENIDRIFERSVEIAGSERAAQRIKATVSDESERNMLLENLLRVSTKASVIENLANVRGSVTSAYRTKEQNKEAGGSKTSAHLQAKAIDFQYEDNADKLKVISAYIQANDMSLQLYGEPLFDQLIIEDAKDEEAILRGNVRWVHLGNENRSGEARGQILWKPTTSLNVVPLKDEYVDRLRVAYKDEFGERVADALAMLKTNLDNDMRASSDVEMINAEPISQPQSINIGEEKIENKTGTNETKETIENTTIENKSEQSPSYLYWNRDYEEKSLDYLLWNRF